MCVPGLRGPAATPWPTTSGGGGGRPTALENLVLVCSFHHRLVHEYSWRLTREGDGELLWRRPDGTPCEAGAGPPARAA